MTGQDNKNCMVYRDKKGILHLIAATADKCGVAAPAEQASVCGAVSLQAMTPFNGLAYNEQALRELAATHGRTFCGQCAATLFAK